eukprot:TRINITY_DN9295_c0_g1_i9.p1 TRINITY_DN9295_c0_g1~~TRINITY_DN9295_c0_g1_i9.p1  ORF type:complete len:361 (+),score=63.90 TRINITY_DN9295_c0_g1_i9:584-1666(+)
MLTVTSNILSPTQYVQPPKQDFLNDLIEGETRDWGKGEVCALRREAARKFGSECRKVLVVAARIHPGEVCGSHVMEGFLKFVCSSDPEAIELRGRLIIKVVPMMNVDGVIVGNYRCSLSGHDLNRQFIAPDPKLHPTVSAVKTMLRDFRDGGVEVEGYIDLHGHSVKKCVFAYGPYYPIHVDRYVRVRILPKLLAAQTLMFRYSACRFKQERFKLNTARLVISREFGVVNSLTLESSFYSFLDQENKAFEFSSKFYEKMGEHLVRALVQYERLMIEERLIKLKRQVKNQKKEKVPPTIQKTPRQRHHKANHIPTKGQRTQLHQHMQVNDRSAKPERACGQCNKARGTLWRGVCGRAREEV